MLGSNYQTQKNYCYDNAGNLIREKITNSPYGASALTYRETSYTYDADGNLTDTVMYSDANTGSYTHYTYDANGRMTAQYTGMSQPYSTSMTAADYQLTQYVYNNLGQQIATIDPLGQTESYTYDANGNMLTGDGATYTYDARDRQSSYVKGSTLASYTYYPTGLRKSKTSNLALNSIADNGHIRFEKEQMSTEPDMHSVPTVKG